MSFKRPILLSFVGHAYKPFSTITVFHLFQMTLHKGLVTCGASHKNSALAAEMKAICTAVVVCISNKWSYTL